MDSNSPHVSLFLEQAWLPGFGTGFSIDYCFVALVAWVDMRPKQ